MAVGLHPERARPLGLAAELNIPDGDAQYALADSHLTGDRPVLLVDQIEVRLNCWRRTILPRSARRMRGAMGIVRSPGWSGEPVILRSFGKPTWIISQKNVGTVGDFEYISPRSPPPLFLPLRLYLPYGYWIEDDGAKVLFARDYKPMWRIREGAAPERLEPWLWIKASNHIHLWDKASTPWDSVELRGQIEVFLAQFRLETLPVWADALPLLIRDDNLHNFADAVEPLKRSRGAAQRTAA